MDCCSLMKIIGCNTQGSNKAWSVRKSLFRNFCDFDCCDWASAFCFVVGDVVFFVDGELPFLCGFVVFCSFEQVCAAVVGYFPEFGCGDDACGGSDACFSVELDFVLRHFKDILRRVCIKRFLFYAQGV